jgi:hypothetical protein
MRTYEEDIGVGGHRGRDVLPRRWGGSQWERHPKGIRGGACRGDSERVGGSDRDRERAYRGLRCTKCPIMYSGVMQPACIPPQPLHSIRRPK